MAVKKHNKFKARLDEVRQIITDENIADHSQKAVCLYGINRNLARAFIDYRDGLKLVQRRILYDIYHELNNPTNYKKVARIVGDVLGKFHPHGETSVASSIVALANDWIMMYPYIDGDGNFGSQLGDSAAAMRYIDARLSKFTVDCFFSEWIPNVVDMKSNFDGELEEPIYLPSKYPMALINPAFSLGYTIRAFLPAHNFTEVCRITQELIKDPDYNFTLYPDSPTECIILKDVEAFKRIYSEGKGVYRSRALTKIETKEDGSSVIYIKNLPWGMVGTDVLEKIKRLGKSGKIQGMSDLIDDSDLNGISMTICIKKGYNPNEVYEKLCKHQVIECFYSVEFEVIDNYKNKRLIPREILLKWINFRRDSKRRYYNGLLSKLRKSLHLLETLLFISDGDNAEIVISKIRKAEDTSDIIDMLIEAYDITNIQAKEIANNIKFASFSKKSIQHYKEVYDTTKNKIKFLDDLVRSKKKLDAVICQELEDGIAKYGRPRRGKLVEIDGDEFIDDNTYKVVVTRGGYIKKMPIATDDKIGRIKKADSPVCVLDISNTKNLIIFTNDGKMFRVRLSLVAICEKNSIGYLISNYAKYISSDIIAVMPEFGDDEIKKMKDMYFMFISKNGMIKKTSIYEIIGSSSNLICMKFKDDDALVDIRLLEDGKDILIYTKKGFGIRFNSNDFTPTLRSSIGVKSIDLKDDDCVTGVEIINSQEKYIFICTQKGYCKKTDINGLSNAKRGKNGLVLTGLENDDILIKVITIDNNKKLIAYLKNKAIDIDIEDVVELSRMSKGKKTIPIPQGEYIIDIR